MKNKVLNILLVGCIMLPLNTFALEKQEVVFTNLNSKGEVVENVVTNHLKYVSKETVEDETILKDILNISGKEKISVNDNIITFKGNGNDITYQGTTDKQLPITTNISYYLNGKSISKKKLIGKKGTVKIEINFKNNSYNEKENMYAPFVVTTATILKGNCYNVTINNGKVVNTGTKNIIVGISTPGLYDDLEFEELKDMDNITISYETNKVEDSDLYFVATPKMFESADLAVFDKLDGLNSSMKQLQDGVNKLIDGSNKLVDGSSLLSDKLVEATEGSKKITNGIGQINSNASTFTSMVTLVDSLYAKYQENTVLLASINDGSAKNKLEAGIIDATSKKNELLEKKAVYDSLKELVDSGIELPLDKQAIYAELCANIGQINAGINQYELGVEEATKKLTSLPTSAAALMGSNQTIELILKSILKVDSMDEVPSSINLFKNNINSLVSGVSILNEGSNNLTNGLVKLADGSLTLYNGTRDLRDGIVRLNNEGITKLTSLSNKVNLYQGKTKKLVKLSKEYSGYSTTNAKETIFIYKVGK